MLLQLLLMRKPCGPAAGDSICAILSPEALKEYVDGEALDWAARRLLQRPERLKILIVICARLMRKPGQPAALSFAP